MASLNRRLKDLAKSIPDEKALQGLMRVLEDATVRGDYPLVIMGAAMIERALEAAIKSRLVPLDEEASNKLFSFEQNGPLAELGARIRMASALGLFGPNTLHDLRLIHQIRNLFAHAANLRGFDDRAVAEACRGVKISRDVRGARQRYTHACIVISSELKERIATQAAQPKLEFPLSDDRLP
jgi:DNA-binding MltR family transcriptional regulator